MISNSWWCAVNVLIFLKTSVAATNQHLNHGNQRHNPTRGFGPRPTVPRLWWSLSRTTHRTGFKSESESMLISVTMVGRQREHLADLARLVEVSVPLACRDGTSVISTVLALRTRQTRAVRYSSRCKHNYEVGLLQDHVSKHPGEGKWNAWCLTTEGISAVSGEMLG